VQLTDEPVDDTQQYGPQYEARVPVMVRRHRLQAQEQEDDNLTRVAMETQHCTLP